LLSQRLRDLFAQIKNRAYEPRTTGASSRQRRVTPARATFLLAVLCCSAVIAICWAAGHSSAQLTSIDLAGSDAAKLNVALAQETLSTPSNVTQTACALIYQGKFDAASELIEQSDQTIRSQLEPLLQIVHDYENITQRRQEARSAAYLEQLSELQKLQRVLEAADINDVGDTADANDANDISDVLPVIVKASEFADEKQRNELLAGPFVQQVFQKAIDRAAELELKGKWLDAYTTCYYWLLASDPNNKAYSDYADQLLDKASIAASFQDSPCETVQQRYSGVKKDMFVRAIHVLNLNYVSSMDYGQMAVDAIRGCEMLAQVLAISSSQNAPDDDSEKSFTPPDAEKLTAWSATLAALLSDEVRQSLTGFSRDDFLAVFEKVMELNAATAELPRAALVAQFAEAALSALDPYTVMVWPRQVQDFEKMMTNEFTGIGIEIAKPKGLLTVASLLPDTPAYKSGLDAGDVIEAVDGVETKDMSLICAVRKITGPQGTEVRLTIRRPGQEKTRDITITRGKITVPTIRGWQRTETGEWLYMIDQQNKLGYIRVTSFSTETASGLEEVLAKLEAEGLKGLILDLRFNSGGLFDSAVGVADKFVEEGIIVTRRPPSGPAVYAEAHKKNTHPNYPLVVLINSNSASGSEIVAGALADEKYNRAILIGDRTHGKGSVQGVTHYPGGGAQLKYTMAYYHLPSGQRVKSRDEVEKLGGHDWGIAPDIQIRLTSDELKKMLDVQRDNDVLVQANRHNSSTPLKKHTAEETLEADPQLAVGLLVIKTKLVEANALNSSTNRLQL
jgi:carboxyl-terminal processing protease